jgi:hypothetical protein
MKMKQPIRSVVERLVSYARRSGFAHAVDDSILRLCILLSLSEIGVVRATFRNGRIVWVVQRKRRITGVTIPEYEKMHSILHAVLNSVRADREAA